jgi:hypothetical protein
VIAAEKLPVQVACRVLAVSEAGYYQRLKRAPSESTVRHAWLTDLITRLAGIDNICNVVRNLWISIVGTRGPDLNPAGCSVGAIRVERCPRSGGLVVDGGAGLILYAPVLKVAKVAVVERQHPWGDIRSIVVIRIAIEAEVIVGTGGCAQRLSTERHLDAELFPCDSVGCYLLATWRDAQLAVYQALNVRPTRLRGSRDRD